MPLTDHDRVELRKLAHASVHRWTYLADQEVEIDSPAGGHQSTINVEVEFWRDANGEAHVAVVRVYEEEGDGWPIKPNRRYLPSPNWLQELLIAAIDTTRLPQGEPSL